MKAQEPVTAAAHNAPQTGSSEFKPLPYPPDWYERKVEIDRLSIAGQYIPLLAARFRDMERNCRVAQDGCHGFDASKDQAAFIAMADCIARCAAEAEAAARGLVPPPPGQPWPEADGSVPAPAVDVDVEIKNGRLKPQPGSFWLVRANKDDDDLRVVNVGLSGDWVGEIDFERDCTLDYMCEDVHRWIREIVPTPEEKGLL